MKLFASLAAAAAFACLTASPLLAQTAPTYKAGAITVASPWTRATPKGAPVAGGYATITNNGAQADRLIGGSFAHASGVEVHTMSMDGGVMRMRKLAEGLEIKPGETVQLKPGGLHLMFVDLKQPVTAGATIKGSLRFEKAGEIEMEFPAARMGSTTPPGGMTTPPGGMSHGGASHDGAGHGSGDHGAH